MYKSINKYFIIPLILNIGIIIIPIISIILHGFENHRMLGFQLCFYLFELVIISLCYIRLFFFDSMFSINMFLILKILAYVFSLLFFGFDSVYQTVDLIVTVASLFFFTFLFSLVKKNKKQENNSQF